jgi:MoxR-like ATPase
VTPGLRKAVNLAIFLRRPLLLEGEAGCGKTRLARAVAYQLGLPYYRWNISSTTKAQEGLYSYDAILRLHDVQILEKLGNQAHTNNPRNPRNYREFGPLGKAFRVTDCPAVVLIDEIDKAELDFPNDLLTVLDEPWEFEIPETQEKITANRDHLPIIIITSNKEKGNLPAPFLRRCLYYYVDFPDQDQLQKIIDIHYEISQKSTKPLEIPSASLTEKAINVFSELREEKTLFKKPGTSELLDWIQALTSFGETIPENLITLENLPYKEVLLKIRNDWDKFRPEPI